MKVQVTYDDTLYQLVPKNLPFDTEMRPVIARMCRKVEGGACILFDDFWSDLLSAAPTPPAQPVIGWTDEEIDDMRKRGWEPAQCKICGEYAGAKSAQPAERRPLTETFINDCLKKLLVVDLSSPLAHAFRVGFRSAEQGHGIKGES